MKTTLFQIQHSPWTAAALPTLTALLVTALFVAGIADHEPWTPDEPRETQMAREMTGGGQKIVPQLAREPFVEKPPLYYWISAAAMSVARGANPAHVARGVCSLFTLLLLPLTGWFAARHWDRRTGFAAAAVLGTMVGTLELSHWIRIDAALAFFTGAAVLLFISGVPARRPHLLWAGYAAAGLAFLTKGVIAWALLALPWAVFALFQAPVVRSRWRWHAAGAGLALAPVLAWAAVFRLAGGAALWREWFWDNQIGRFTGSARHLGHIHGPFYYLPLILAVLLPWTPLVIAFFTTRASRQELGRGGGQRAVLWAMAAWAVGGLLLLSASGTKRTIYLYPLLPGFAVLAAAAADSAPRWAWRTIRIITAAFAVLMWPLIVLTATADGRNAALALTFQPAVLALAAAAAWLWLRGGARPALQAAAVSACFYLAVILALIPVFDAFKNYEPFIRQFADGVPLDQRPGVCGWGLDQTTRAQLPYYTGWTVENLSDPARLHAVLAGQDPHYQAVIVQIEKRFPPRNTNLPPWREIQRVAFPTRRSLALITGTGAAAAAVTPPAATASPPAERSTPADGQRSGS